jgi:hypothetical protein
VLTGHTDAGVSCVAYEDANGAVGSTAGRLGDLPIGDVLPGKMQGVIFGLVPPVTTRSLLDRFRSRS